MGRNEIWFFAFAQFSQLPKQRSWTVFYRCSSVHNAIGKLCNARRLPINPICKTFNISQWMLHRDGKPPIGKGTMHYQCYTTVCVAINIDRSSDISACIHSAHFLFFLTTWWIMMLISQVFVGYSTYYVSFILFLSKCGVLLFSCGTFCIFLHQI